MQSPNPNIIYLVIKHVNQEVQALLSNAHEVLREKAHGFDPCYSHSHRVIFKH